MWWGQAMLAGFSLLCYTGGRGRAAGTRCRLTNQPHDVGHHLSSLCASLLPQPLQQPSEGWSQGFLTARYSCCTPSMSVPKGCKSTLILRTAWMTRHDAEPLLLPWGDPPLLPLQRCGALNTGRCRSRSGCALLLQLIQVPRC